MRVAVIVESGVHNFSAYAPDVPGCVSTGRTVEETLSNMQEALALHLEGLAEDGTLPQLTCQGFTVEVSLDDQRNSAA
ncbi:MAG: type II toxin-antitoxin system HicB family antitoxin [Armatimonadetes bacterium]|nr:type II toxin-antitoxin system HicB family antitoxin [Armatimonadota bacterium]